VIKRKEPIRSQKRNSFPKEACIFMRREDKES